MPTYYTHLTQIFSTTVDFYYTYKYFHWRITGQDFREFHLIFDEHAMIIFKSQDVVAERLRQMDQPVSGLLEDYSKQSVIEKTKPDPRDNIQEVLKHLNDQHAHTINLLEKTIDLSSEEKDFSTADILTKLLQDHQQMQWFIRSSIV
jgi:starvation-inducible DNA-binding protein